MNASATVSAQEPGASAEPKSMNAPRPEVPEGFESFGRQLTGIEERVAAVHEHGATKADIQRLDGKISVLDARVASIEKHGATKVDIRALEARIGWWILGVIVLIVVGLVLEIVRL